MIGSFAALACQVAPAGATGTGGTAAPRPHSKRATKRRHPTPPVPANASPITAVSPALLYTGPVFEKTATGEVIPFVPPTPEGQTSGKTGGSPVGVSASTKPQLLVPGSLARWVNGLAAAPIAAPAVVQQVIWS